VPSSDSQWLFSRRLYLTLQKNSSGLILITVVDLPVLVSCDKVVSLRHATTPSSAGKTVNSLKKELKPCWLLSAS